MDYSYNKYKIKVENILIKNEYDNEIEEINYIVNNDNFSKFLEEINIKYNYIKLYNFSAKEYFYKYKNDLLLYNLLEIICKRKLKEEKFNNYIYNLYELTYYIIDNRIQLLNSLIREYYSMCLNYDNLSRKYKKDFDNYRINMKKKLTFLKAKKKNLVIKESLNYIFINYYKRNLILINNKEFDFNDININKNYVLSIEFYNNYNIKEDILIKFILELLYINKIENLHILFKYIKYFVYNFNYKDNIENEIIDRLLEYYIKIEKDGSIYDYEKINMKKEIIYFFKNNKKILNKNDNKLLINFIYILLIDISNYIVEYIKLDKELEEKKQYNNSLEINIIIREKNYYLLLISKFTNVIKKYNNKILLEDEIINKLIIVFNDLINLLIDKSYVGSYLNDTDLNDIIKLYNNLYIENEETFIKNILSDERYCNDINFFIKLIDNTNIDNKELINIIIEKIKKKNLSKIEIPEKYCDPLYYTLINNPIELPGCLNIMEESIIKEYLLLKNENPFNREYLDLNLLYLHNKKDDVKIRINNFKNELKLFKDNNNLN
jgi:hypothetical protein